MSDRSIRASSEMSRLWWVYLVFGIFWVLFGMSLWSYRIGSILALAVFIGITLIFNGLTCIAAALRLDEWRMLLFVIGLLSAAAGVVVIAWPGETLYILSLFLAWFLVITGIVHVVIALAEIRRPYWWLILIQGLIEFALGAWARGAGRSVLLFVNLAGAFALLRGFNEIFAAFELRRLDRGHTTANAV